jgi:hypothetical protein
VGLPIYYVAFCHMIPSSRHSDSINLCHRNSFACYAGVSISRDSSIISTKLIHNPFVFTLVEGCSAVLAKLLLTQWNIAFVSPYSSFRHSLSYSIPLQVSSYLSAWRSSCTQDTHTRTRAHEHRTHDKPPNSRVSITNISFFLSPSFYAFSRSAITIAYFYICNLIYVKSNSIERSHKL